MSYIYMYIYIYIYISTHRHIHICKLAQGKYYNYKCILPTMGLILGINSRIPLYILAKKIKVLINLVNFDVLIVAMSTSIIQ